MTLLADIKTALRVVSEATDPEVRMLMNAARRDMERAGVDPTLLALDPESEDLENELVKHGVTAYCKAHYGYDNDEALRFSDSYERVLVDLLNSSANVAAIAAEADDAEGAGDEPGGDGPEGGSGEPEGGPEGGSGE